MNVFVHYFGLASKLFGAPINNTQELLLLPSNKIFNEKKHTQREIYSLGKQNRTSEKKNVGRRQSFGGRMNVIYMCFQEGWKTWGKRYFMKIHAVSQRQQQQQKKIKIKHTHRCHSKCVSVYVSAWFFPFLAMRRTNKHYSHSHQFTNANVLCMWAQTAECYVSIY